MREIKFRGQIVGNGNWTYGDLIQLIGEQGKGRKFIVNNKFGACIDEEGNFINTESPFVNEVDPETVGQLTGLKVQSGRELYEGDLFRTSDAEAVYIDIVVWNAVDGSWAFDNAHGHCSVLANDINLSHGEIIGNIHDNADLLPKAIDSTEILNEV